MTSVPLINHVNRGLPLRAVDDLAGEIAPGDRSFKFRLIPAAGWWKRFSAGWPMGRLSEKNPPGSAQDVYYGYDQLGRLLYAHFGSTGGAGVDYAFDALGRAVTETASGRALSYQYDLDGNRTRITWPDASSNTLYVAYDHDLLNRVTQIEENGAASGPGLLAVYTYDQYGHRTQIARGGGSGAQTLADYDRSDRVSSLTQNFAGAADDVNWQPSYSWGAAPQMTALASTNDAYGWHPGVATKAYTANGLNQYAAVAGTSFGYDGRGNLTSDGVRAFTYDVENRLLTASAPTAVTLTYDPLGRLQTSASGGATDTLLFAGSDLVGEYDSSGNIVGRYVPGPGVDEPLVWYSGPGTTNRRWLQADVQGSVVAWSDASANKLGSEAYAPYGEPSAWSGGPRYAWTGQIAIPQAQVYWFKARNYDPGLGRFLQTDPIGYAGDVDAYAYVGNDPVNGWDPSGLDGCPGPNNCQVTVLGNGQSTSTAGNGDTLTDNGDGSFVVCCAWGKFHIFDVILQSMAINSVFGVQNVTIGPSGAGVSIQNLLQSKISCSTRLPNGQTVGQVVQNSIANIESAAGPYDTGAGEFGAFVATVQSNGPIDFKNNFKGAASPAFLGAAGNFAYGAVAAGLGYSQGVAEFGAGAYALSKSFHNPNSPYGFNPNNPFGEDNSAAKNLPAGYASGGC